MDIVIALVVLALAAIGGAWLATRVRESMARRRVQQAAAERCGASWEVGEEGGRGLIAAGGAGGVTRVFVRKVTPDGAEVDRIAVAEVASNAADWEDRMIEARSKAGQRAQILNGEP